jgi:hypothetical protein
LLPFVSVRGAKGPESVAWTGGICRMDGGTETRLSFACNAFQQAVFPNTVYQRQAGRFPTVAPAALGRETEPRQGRKRAGGLVQ